jgi:NADPH-dependent 2,4-dienoyl-CoA reductase/sulfur reductase-like enzyme
MRAWTTISHRSNVLIGAGVAFLAAAIAAAALHVVRTVIEYGPVLYFEWQHTFHTS